MPIDPVEVIEGPAGAVCSFCKRERTAFRYAFINEPRDTFICNWCVDALSEKLKQVRALGPLDAPTRTN
jgi:hypothetical protein